MDEAARLAAALDVFEGFVSCLNGVRNFVGGHGELLILLGPEGFGVLFSFAILLHFALERGEDVIDFDTPGFILLNEAFAVTIDL